MDPLWKSLLAPRNVVPDVVDSIFCFTCHGHGHRDVRPCCFTCYGHPVLFHMWDTHEQFSLAISTPTVFLFLSFSTHSCHYRPLVLRMDHTINFGSPLRGPYDSGGTNSNWDLDSISICTEKWEFLDVGDVWDVAFSVATVILVKSCVALRVASVPLKSCCPGIPESRASAAIWCIGFGESGVLYVNWPHGFLSFATSNSVQLWPTGWRRLIGSPKLQIISTKEPLNIGHFPTLYNFGLTHQEKKENVKV